MIDEISIWMQVRMGDDIDNGEHQESTVMISKVNTYYHYLKLALSNGEIEGYLGTSTLVKQDNK